MSRLALVRNFGLLFTLIALLGCAAVESADPSAESSAAESPTVESPTAELSTTGLVSSAPPISPTEPEIVIDYQAAVDATLRTFVESAKGGATIAISFHGEPVTTSAAGSAGGAAVLVSNSPMRVGSLTKPFMAVMVMQLVQEGMVKLDSPVSRYPPQVSVADGVTVRQLLDHSSGIADYTDASFAAQASTEPAKVWTPQLILDHISAAPRVFVAGSKYEYSNTNYVIVGLLIEKVTGKPIAQNLTERITAPLGLVDTYLAPDPTRTPVAGFGSELPGGWTETMVYTSIETAAGTAGALVSTAPELVTFLLALADGRLVSQASLATMTQFSKPDGYGLGLFPVQFPGGQGFGHDGSTPGFITQMGIEPNSGAVFVILCNDTDLYPNDLAVGLFTLGL